MAEKKEEMMEEVLEDLRSRGRREAGRSTV